MLLIIAFMAGIGPVYAQPTIRVLPVSADLLNTYDLGAEFDITINVEGVTDLGQWVLFLAWDSSVLNYAGTFEGPPGDLDRITKGTFLSQAGATSIFDDVESAGSITGLSEVLLPMPSTGASGSGLLVTIGMKVVGYGSTVIDITESHLLDHTLAEITHNVVTTTFDNTGLKPLPYAPTVDFTYSPTVVYENDIVTFTATTTPGFDGDNIIAVSEYRWNFDGVATLTTDVPTADFNYTTAGSYNPSVEVYAGPNPGYETASKSKPLIVYAVALSYVDVYTEKKGSGPNVYGSAFEPGQEVTISADVLYEGVQVNDTWVSFQIVDVTGDNVTFRAAITVAGTATINVRLPLMGTEHLTGEGDFGLFKCIATANVFEKSFNDTVSFNVGWIVDTVNVTATSTSRGGTTTITVNTNNFALEEQPVFLTVTVYDSVGVAVGVASVSFTIPPASSVGLDRTPSLDTRSFGVLIPTDAWPGPATVYVNCFDKSPLAGGDAWCSEISTTFAIT